MRIAMLCAEQDPLTCHRTILIARHVKELAADVRHILPDGRTESQTEAEQRLLVECKPDHCHRRLVAEYLRDKWNGELTITHLL